MQTLYFCPVVCSIFFYFLSSFFPRLTSAVGCVPYFHTWWGHICEFKMQVWNVLHAALWKYRTQKSPSGHHRTTLSGYSCATEAHIDNRKKLLNSSTSSTCRYNMVNFSPLASEIGSVVWGTPADFNGFRILATLLLDTSSERASAKLCGVERMAPPIFAGAAIMLGIDPLYYIAPHCKRCTSYGNSIRPPVRVKTTAHSTMQFALSDSKICLVL